MEIFRGLRIYICGKVERKFRGKYWREVKNTANHSDGYNCVSINGKLWRRHRLVVAAFNKNFDINNLEHQVDHIDNDKLHNAFSNLRVVTNQVNTFNKPTVKGYTWDKKTGKCRAQIRIDNNQKHLGSFDTEEEARAAYLVAKEKYHVIETVC
jgi:hypothetical protein